ncbi:MAG: hypothetical protein WD824_17150 [Cyclobacteriaceae bacterium]
MNKNNENDKAKNKAEIPGQNTEASRRKFLKKGILTAMVFPTAIACTKESSGKSSTETDPNSCIDYGQSFFCNTAEFNSVRMWIESRTIITDIKSGKTNVYYQGASCKSENTFGETDLFYKENYDFLPIFGEGHVLVFRRHSNKRGEGYQSMKKMEEMWGGNPVIYTPVPKVVTELDTFEKIRDATAAGIPIVTQTEFQNDETGLRALIEAPCKTMNISHPKKMYQVDTGPLAFPDLSKKYDPQIKCLNLAFIAFNKSNFADFVIEAPTAIKEGDKQVGTVYHYSKMATVKVKNRIFALG